MAAVTITGGIHHQRLASPGPDPYGLMAEAAQPGVLHSRLLGPAGIKFHHPAVFVARQAERCPQPSDALAAEFKRTLGGWRRTAIGVHGLHHMGLKVFLGGEHRAPGRLPAGAVGEGADHPITEPIVVALAISAAEHRSGRAGAAQLLAWLLQAAQTMDAPLLRSALVSPAAIALTHQTSHSHPQILQSGCSHCHRHRLQSGVCLCGVRLQSPPCGLKGFL